MLVNNIIVYCLSPTDASHSKKYHKYITNIPQIYHKSTTKCDIVPQKCDIVPQKCDIVPQKCDIVPRNCDIVPQKGVVYYKV